MNPLVFYIVGMGQRIPKRFSKTTTYITDKIENPRNPHAKIIANLIDGALNINQLQKQTKLNKQEYEKCIKELLEAKLIQKTNHKLSNTLPVFTEQTMQNISKQTENIAAEEADTVEKHLENLAQKWEQLGNMPEWNILSHLVADVFILDILFLRAIKSLEKKNGFWEKRTEGQRILPAFFLEHTENLLNFGVNTYMPPNIIELHGTLFKRETTLTKLLLNKEVWHTLKKLKTPQEPLTLNKETQKLLAKYKWIKKKNNGYYLTIPIVQLETIETIIPELAQASVSAAQTVINHYPQITQMFQNSPFAKYLKAPGDYIDYVHHIIMLQTIQKLINKKALPKIPKPTPWNIGVYLLPGKTRKILKTFFKTYKTITKITGTETEWGKPTLTDGIIFYLTSKLLGA